MFLLAVHGIVHRLLVGRGDEGARAQYKLVLKTGSMGIAPDQAKARDGA
jgi:hypothetical protein